MVAQAEILSSLAYFAVLYPVMIFAYRGEKVNRRKCVWTVLTIAIAALAIKLGIKMNGTGRNYYSVLEVSRHSTAMEIRQAYKKVSKKLHPDKNPSPNADAMFQEVKVAYDVLMDESQRDIYNRFGLESLAFDPRLDELKLLSTLSALYLYWLVATYIITIPIAGKASRTWIAIFGIGVVILEISLCLTESSLPSWTPSTLTEHELIGHIHSIFPAVIIAFANLATSLYVDIDKTSIGVLKELTLQQKALAGILNQLQVIISQSSDKKQEASSMENIVAKLAELHEIMEVSGESTIGIIETLKNSSENPGSNYYWLIFVVMYGGVYFFQ